MRKATPKFKIDKKLQRALDAFPKLVKEQERNFRAREKDIARFAKLSKQLLEIREKPAVHPWRLCPYGHHWVRTHPMRTKPSKKRGSGSITTRFNHCAKNRSGKDHLYPQEIQQIAQKNFTSIKELPCEIDLKMPRGGDFDFLIAGWVKYWNEVLKPTEHLDPNLVKALIASESRFDPNRLANKKDSNSARGLLQITNKSRRTLGDAKGELKDYFVTATKSDFNNPNINICAGVRWLFHKRHLASAKLKHDASWIEAVGEYKGLSRARTARAEELLDRFVDFYRKLSECKQS